jgi:hypothetical protein
MMQVVPSSAMNTHQKLESKRITTIYENNFDATINSNSNSGNDGNDDSQDMTARLQQYRQSMENSHVVIKRNSVLKKESINPEMVTPIKNSN